MPRGMYWQKNCVLAADSGNPHVHVAGTGSQLAETLRTSHRGTHSLCTSDTPNLPTKIIPVAIRWLRTSGKLPMDMRIPPLSTKIMFESNPLEIRNLSTEIGRAWLQTFNTEARHAHLKSESRSRFRSRLLTCWQWAADTAVLESSSWKHRPSPSEVWTSKGRFRLNIS